MIDCVYLIFLTGLILCSEPYYNEAGYEKQRGTAEGRENSRMYSEMVLLKLVQSMERLLNKPPEGLQNEILQHFAHHGARLELLKGKKKKTKSICYSIARIFEVFSLKTASQISHSFLFSS